MSIRLKDEAALKAASATKLATARKIGNASFDGTADISLSAIGAVGLASPAFTGTPTAPTATAGTNTTQLATTAFVTTAINNKTSVSGNAGTATSLQTARTINGTSFNGTANITTANWGTARTLTIGNSGKSVNGSGNVSWSLSEIGALPIAGGTMTGTLTSQNIVPKTHNTYVYGTSSNMIKELYSGYIRVYDPTNKRQVVALGNGTEGTTSLVGTGYVTAGNNVASGTVGNAKGILRLYGSGTGFTNITNNNTGADEWNLTLPNKSGTIATTADVNAKLSLSGGTLTGSIKYSGAGHTSTAIRFENASDTNGNFMGLGAGGMTVIGSGESVGAVYNTFADKTSQYYDTESGLDKGAEHLILASDTDIDIFTNVQNTENINALSAKTQKFRMERNGIFRLSGNYITRFTNDSGSLNICSGTDYNTAPCISMYTNNYVDSEGSNALAGHIRLRTKTNSYILDLGDDGVAKWTGAWSGLRITNNSNIYLAEEATNNYSRLGYSNTEKCTFVSNGSNNFFRLWDDGRIQWMGKNVLYDTSVGSITKFGLAGGSFFKGLTDTAYQGMEILAGGEGTWSTGGAGIVLANKNATSRKGWFMLRTGNGSTYYDLIGKPDATLTWGKAVISATSGTLSSTSDARAKHNIESIADMPKLLTSENEENMMEVFFDKLVPKTFAMNGEEEKIHIGFVAQDVKEALEEVGIPEEEAGVLTHTYWTDEETEEEKEVYGLAYSEFVALNTYMIQKVKKEKKELEAKVEAQQAQIDELRALLKKQIA